MKPILLTEQNHEDSGPLIFSLEQAGYAVVHATSAKKTLDLLRKTPDAFELLCCKVCLPCMDGFEVLQWVRQNPATQNLPVVMLAPIPNEHYSYLEWKASKPRHRITKAGQGGYIAFGRDYETRQLNTGDVIAAIEAVLSGEPGTVDGFGGAVLFDASPSIRQRALT